VEQPNEFAGGAWVCPEEDMRMRRTEGSRVCEGVSVMDDGDAYSEWALECYCVADCAVPIAAGAVAARDRERRR
jgi:hypothetical protein